MAGAEKPTRTQRPVIFSSGGGSYLSNRDGKQRMAMDTGGQKMLAPLSDPSTADAHSAERIAMDTTSGPEAGLVLITGRAGCPAG